MDAAMSAVSQGWLFARPAGTIKFKMPQAPAGNVLFAKRYSLHNSAPPEAQPTKDKSTERGNKTQRCSVPVSMRQANRTFHTIKEPDLDLLWRFSLRLTRNHGEAEALLSKSCQRFIELQDQLRQELAPQEPARSEQCGQKHRGGRRRSHRVMLGMLYRIWVDQFRNPPLQLHTDQNTNPLPNVSTEANFKEERSHESLLIRIIQNLPEAQRLVVLLVCVEELSVTDTAEILNLSLASVNSRLARARIAIGEHYLHEHRAHPVYNSAS